MSQQLQAHQVIQLWFSPSWPSPSVEPVRPRMCKGTLTVLVQPFFSIYGCMYSMYQCVAWAARRLAIKWVLTVMTVSRQGRSVCPRIILHINNTTCEPKVDSWLGFIVCLQVVNAGPRPDFLLRGAWGCGTFSGCHNHYWTDSGHPVSWLRNAGESTLRTLRYLEALLVQDCAISVCANQKFLHMGEF